MIVSSPPTPLCSVYGPVNSWRYGRSLGIDPIGPISTCPFNCVYCQLGEIVHPSDRRQVFVPTEKILTDLQGFAPWDVDAITLSGSGEPTLALNLGEIIDGIKAITTPPVVVLTNGALLTDPDVRQALARADKVSIKLDAICQSQLQRVNRPLDSITIRTIKAGVEAFRAEFLGDLALQTMLLSPWSDAVRDRYIQIVLWLAPDEVQLNVPSRPKPRQHETQSRGNCSRADLPDSARQFRLVDPATVADFATEIETATGVPVRYPALRSQTH